MKQKLNQAPHLQVKVLYPFSPRMLLAGLPDEMVDGLNKICDDTIANEQKRKELNVGHTLVGQVTEELDADIGHYQEFGNYLFTLVKTIYLHFQAECSEDNLVPDTIKRLAVDKAWFVRSFKGDYNPAHKHENTAFSCIAFLKVPDSITDKNLKHKKNKPATEGRLDFIHSSAGHLTPGNYLVKPEVGDIYIFPSSLTHTVYPFWGEGERRTFSANMDLEFFDR